MLIQKNVSPLAFYLSAIARSLTAMVLAGILLATGAAEAGTAKPITVSAGAMLVIHSDVTVDRFDIPDVRSSEALGTADGRLVVTGIHQDTTVTLQMHDGQELDIPVKAVDGAPMSACIEVAKGLVTSSWTCQKAEVFEHTLVTAPGATFGPMEVLALMKLHADVHDVVQSSPMAVQ
jgi:hypothetical protein